MAPAAAIFTHGADLFGNRRLIAACRYRSQLRSFVGKDLVGLLETGLILPDRRQGAGLLVREIAPPAALREKGEHLLRGRVQRLGVLSDRRGGAAGLCVGFDRLPMLQDRLHQRLALFDRRCPFAFAASARSTACQSGGARNRRQRKKFLQPVRILHVTHPYSV